MRFEFASIAEFGTFVCSVAWSDVRSDKFLGARANDCLINACELLAFVRRQSCWTQEDNREYGWIAADMCDILKRIGWQVYGRDGVIDFLDGDSIGVWLLPE